MQQLQYIQQQFWKSLRSQEVSVDYEKFISEGGKLTSAEKLNIYRLTSRTAHVNALAQRYACCEKILGEKYFNQLAKQYFYKYPATNQNLNLYGQFLPEFLQNYVTRQSELKDYQYLPDLARFEQAYEQAYHAKDDEPFDFSTLASLDAQAHQNLCFKLSASLYILQSEYPIYEIWHANQDANQQQDIQAVDEPQHLCIYRLEFKPIIEKISPTYWWVLKNIQDHLSLSQLEVLSKNKNGDFSLQVTIPKLIQKKWVCGYYLKDTNNV